MRRILTGLAVVLGVWALPGNAYAITCPATGDAVDGQNRQYTLETSTACVYGTGNLNGGDNDEFLGTGNSGEVQGSEGTSDLGINVPNGGGGGWAVADFNLLSGLTNGDDGGNWTLNAAANTEYGIALKDGGVPKWAVFLIAAVGTAQQLSGTWSISGGVIDQGDLSHSILYSRSVPPPPVVTPVTQPQEPGPEPTMLVLLGTGLVLAGRRLRRTKA